MDFAELKANVNAVLADMEPRVGGVLDYQVDRNCNLTTGQSFLQFRIAVQVKQPAPVVRNKEQR